MNKTLTKQEAKDLTIKVWKELSEDGNLREKDMISPELYKEIEYFNWECPLCELFNEERENPDKEWNGCCNDCPLKIAGEQCNSGGDIYTLWSNVNCPAEKRERHAQDLLNIVEEWRF